MSDAQFNSAASSSSSSPQVTIKYGVYTDKLPAGSTVASARQRIGQLTQMSADTQAYVNGQKVDENTVLDGNSTVQFMKRTGEKGSKALCLI